MSFPTCRGAIHRALFRPDTGTGRNELRPYKYEKRASRWERPYMLAALLVMLFAACSGEKGPCKQCIEEMTLPAVQFSCDLWLKQQGKKDGDPGRAAAYDDCMKKGLDAALKNDNNIKEARERCKQTGRCKK